MSVLNKTWKVRCRSSELTLTEKLLKNRNLTQPQAIQDFFTREPEKHLHDPFIMLNMERAVERIQKAIQNKERILIFGDYDVDGMTSTAILYQILTQLKAKVSYRLPHRVKDGYGLNPKFIKTFANLKVKLLITVDCGISNRPEIQLAKEQGIDVIITDHHSIPEPPLFPEEAHAILHPQQKKCPYPYKNLAGAGIALKLAHALIQRHYPKKEELQRLEPFIDFASLGTVADIAPLTGENRMLVKHGLTCLQKTTWPGLRQLKNRAGLSEEEKVTVETIGFMIAPRLNAAGRIANSYLSLKLLLEESDKAEELAQRLERLNQNRQKMTRLALQQAESQLKNPSEQKIIIAHHQDWHTGIIGLVAGKIADKYGRPCIIMEDRGDCLVGSARSITGFNMIEAIRNFSQYLDHYGGHPQAAGFNISKKNLQPFINDLTDFTEKNINLESVKTTLPIDCEILPQDINMETYRHIQRFAPFGLDNETPTFLLKNIRAVNIRTVGGDQQHLKFTAQITPYKHLEVIAFQMGPLRSELNENTHLDLVCQLHYHQWNGRSSLELKAQDFRV